MEVDRRLAASNFLYKGGRHAHVLAPLQLRLIPNGSWSSYSHSEQSRRGTGDAQYKHPALVNDANLLLRFSAVDVIEIPGQSASPKS